LLQRDGDCLGHDDAAAAACASKPAASRLASDTAVVVLLLLLLLLLLLHFLLTLSQSFLALLLLLLAQQHSVLVPLLNHAPRCTGTGGTAATSWANASARRVLLCAVAAALFTTAEKASAAAVLHAVTCLAASAAACTAAPVASTASLRSAGLQSCYDDNPIGSQQARHTLQQQWARRFGGQPVHTVQLCVTGLSAAAQLLQMRIYCCSSHVLVLPLRIRFVSVAQHAADDGATCSVLLAACFDLWAVLGFSAVSGNGIFLALHRSPNVM
jgi:hypothetical protein